MTERMIENRIKKLRKLEAQQKELEAAAEAIRAELKADLEEKGVDELKTKNFILHHQPRRTAHREGGGGMNELFSKTFSELTTAAPLDIRGLGDKPLTVCQLTGLWAVVNHRYENLLPTTTHTDKKPWELCKAIESPGYETLAYALVGRLWEMGVERSGRAAARR